jgi:hypothetical protein
VVFHATGEIERHATFCPHRPPSFDTIETESKSLTQRSEPNSFVIITWRGNTLHSTEPSA